MGIKEAPGEPVLIDDFIKMAREGIKISVNIGLEYVTATEHFEYHKNSQTYLVADFHVSTPAKPATCLRCVGCYPTEKEEHERPVQMQVANDRLSLLYREFDLHSVGYEKRFFG